jgi:DNA polymerase I-like protein with 3'-5' exonuclease and polymerase domains
MIKVFKHPDPRKGDPSSDIHALTAKLFSDRGLDIPRSLAKAINHASNYGMGPGTLSLELTDAGFPTTQTEASVYIELYHSIYPSVRSVYHRSIEGELKRNSTVTNLLGRKRYFQRPQNDDLLRKAYDYKAQSTVADVMNEGMVKAYNETGDDIDLLAQIHDELLGQIRWIGSRMGWVAERLMRVKDCLELELEVHGETFTIPAEIKVGFNWRDMEELDARTFDGLVDGLLGVYRKHGITDTVSPMGGTGSDLSGAAEKGVS